MLTVRQKKCLKRGLCPEREQKKRIWRLKGWPEITLPTRHYSLKEKGDSLYLLRDGEEISFFLKGVAGETVTNYASGYEFALKKKKERNALLKAAPKNKETFFKRSYSGRWR